MPDVSDNVTTAEQLAAMPDDGKRYALVEGILHMMSPAGGHHGEIAARLLVSIANHVEQNHLGKTYAAETGFLLAENPDTVLAPDVAFVSFERLGDFAKHPTYIPVAPDLVAEVVSPHDRSVRVEAKTQTWLAAGVRAVLVVDPQTSMVRGYRRDGQVMLPSDGRLDLQNVIPGFQLDVVDLFA